MNFQVAATLFVLWAGMAGVAAADDSELARATLAGLKGVAIIVEQLPPEVERAGLKRAVLQTDAELKLRVAGIRVLTQEELDNDPAYPYLYIQPTILLRGGAYACSVQLHQRVLVVRSHALEVVASTWSAGGAGVAPMNEVPERVRGALKDLVDEFINAYLSANPKK